MFLKFIIIGKCDGNSKYSKRTSWMRFITIIQILYNSKHIKIRKLWLISIKRREM
jgi:hypothetical protein